MEKSSVKVYSTELVIELSATSGTSETKITCVECCGSRMFIGTLGGILIEYFVVEEVSNTGSSSQYSKVRETTLHQGQPNQPILLIRAASALDSLIILSGNMLALFDSHSLELKGNNGVGSVTAVSIDENPVCGDPFVVQFCFSRKNYINLAEATEKGFNLTREINVDSFALNLCMESGLICAALANSYYIMINSQKKTKPMQLCTYDIKDKPRVSHANKDEFLVLGPGGLGVFVTKDGTSERPPISWPRKIIQMSVHCMNVVALGEDCIFVHSLSDYQTCHTIPLAGVRCSSLTEGNLYCGTLKNLYRLKPISIAKQVEELLDCDEVEKAFSLLRISNLKRDEQTVLHKQIHLKAVFIHLASFNFEAARTSIEESNLDLREIVSLFPNILPGSSTFTRSLPPLHNYSDITAICKGDYNKLDEFSTFLMCILRDSESTPHSKDLATALVKLATQFDHSNTFAQILKSINEFNIDKQDLQEWLEKRKFFNSLALIYKYWGEVVKALDIWINILENKIECMKGDEFVGVQSLIDTLVEVDDPVVVWPYFEKVISMCDHILAVEVFTRKPISANFPPLKVAEKLKKWPDICILYLEDCISEKDIQDEDCHTYLATLYIDHLLSNSDASEQNRIPNKLRQFLIDSNCLRVQFLIGKLQNSNLRFELAILHGKAGDHNPALIVFTKELNDHRMAREYCSKLKNSHERKRAFVDLLKIYLDSPMNLQNPETIVSLLCDFGEEFDLKFVLPMLPDDWSIEIISSVLRRAVRNSIHKKRSAKLLASLSQRVNLDTRLQDHDRNQGYSIQPESRCCRCSKLFDLIDPIFYENGFIVHEKCM